MLYLGIFIVLYCVVLFFSRFCPTELWFVRKMRLWKYFPDLAVLKYPSPTLLRSRFMKLIINRCADENIRLSEIRNGYTLIYYPEGVMRKGRFWTFPYVEIEDGDATVYIGCRSSKNHLFFHIRYNDTVLTKKKMFKRYSDGNMQEFMNFLAGDKTLEMKYRNLYVEDLILQLL